MKFADTTSRDKLLEPDLKKFEALNYMRYFQFENDDKLNLHEYSTTDDGFYAVVVFVVIDEEYLFMDYSFRPIYLINFEQL